MLITGTGFTAFPVKIKVDYKPVTTYALSWQQLSSGNWIATDRGAAQDIYECDNVTLYGTEAKMKAFAVAIEANREAGSNVVTLSGFNSQEHIFGADLNYTGNITATIDMNRRSQGTWKGFEQTCKVVAVSPPLLANSGSLPLLRCLDINYDGDEDETINKLYSYNRNNFYQDHSSDYGTFTGTFTFTDSEMKQLRSYIRTQRSNTVSIPNISGVSSPFGIMSSSYPYNVKIIKFEDRGMWDNNFWSCDLTFALVR